jgi:8-oxo-dGTP pyrophosphatase MutT (NUDIX family)
LANGGCHCRKEDLYMDRVRAILIEASNILLIEREKGGRHYFVFPGGGIEEGEAPE